MKKLNNYCLILVSFFGLFIGCTMETTVSERISEYDYLPFCNSEKLVHLDEESTLKFSESDELPVIEGATALLPVYCSLAEAVYPSTTVAWCTKDSDGNFQFNDDKKIIVDYNYGTRSAYNNLIDRKVDIIFVAYPSQEQIDEALKNNVEFNYTPIGKEAFVFVVNSKNPVSSLSSQQVKDIYTGKITNWKEVGGKNRKIKAFQRSQDSGSQSAFLRFMDNDENIIEPRTNLVYDVMSGLVKEISDYNNGKDAIGYSFRFYVETMTNDPNVKMINLDDVKPSVENIQNGSYPVASYFYAVTRKGEETENVKKFLDWMVTDQAQRLITKTGYVGVN